MKLWNQRNCHKFNFLWLIRPNSMPCSAAQSVHTLFHVWMKYGLTNVPMFLMLYAHISAMLISLYFVFILRMHAKVVLWSHWKVISQESFILSNLGFASNPGYINHLLIRNLGSKMQQNIYIFHSLARKSFKSKSYSWWQLGKERGMACASNPDEGKGPLLNLDAW